MKITDNKYEIGQLVYLKTDTEQFQRIVTAITLRETGIIYELSCGEKVSCNYEFEITEQINIGMKIT